jgi:hypothetical protein
MLCNRDDGTRTNAAGIFVFDAEHAMDVHDLLVAYKGKSMLQ